MKLLLDDKQHRGYDLNANEACIFAAVLKCTRAGRGWYGNYRELAAAMPFVMSHETARRAVQKLLNLGLMERREEKLFAVTQIVTDDAQNVTEPTQIVTDDAQNVTEPTQNVTSDAQIVLPPNNPPIINNMNEKEKEQQRALCARDCEKQQDCLFEKFWKFFNPAPQFHNRRAATQMIFEARSEAAQRQMIEAAQEGAPGHPGDNPNPYFYVQDFPEPKPTFLRGDESGDIVQVRYNGAYKLCSRETMHLFNLEFVRNW